MKYFTSITPVLLVLLLVITGALQPINGQEQKSRLPPLVAQLKLSDGQKKKLESMYEEQQQKIKAIREDTSLSNDEKKAKLKEINQATNKFLGEVLTAKQREKLKELRQKQ